MARFPDDARLERIVERMEQSGAMKCADLNEGDQLILTVADGQRIRIDVCNPAQGSVMVTSTGPWSIWIHVTDNWGMTMSETGGCLVAHQLCTGYRLFLGVWVTPAVIGIELNGFDLSNPSAQQKN